MPEPEPDDTGRRAAVERTLLVPRRFKKFDQSAADARATYGVDPLLLDNLVRLGLAYQDSAVGPRFDQWDLANIGLALGLPTPTRRAMRWWSRSLLSRDSDPTSRRSVRLSATCPDPRHAGGCRFEFNPLVAARTEPGSLRREGPGAYEFDIRLDSGTRFFGEAQSAFIARMSQVQFHFVPEQLGSDVDFVESVGLADCRLATRFGLRLATGMGLGARETYGFFLAGPYLLWHNWLELNVDGEWLAADPFWLTALARWGVPGSDRWPPNRWPGPLLWRPCAGYDSEDPDEPFHIIAHNDVPTPALMMSTIARQ